MVLLFPDPAFIQGLRPISWPEIFSLLEGKNKNFFLFIKDETSSQSGELLRTNFLSPLLKALILLMKFLPWSFNN